MFDLLRKKLSGVVSKVSKTVTEKKVSKEELIPIIGDLELSLLEADVAFEVSEKIRENLEEKLTDKTVKRGKVKETVKGILKDSLSEVLNLPKINLEDFINKKKPCLLVFLGFNGSGKTTSLAKIAHFLKKKGFLCVFAAADTFRAASIEQLQEHADKLKLKMIKHKYGSDAAAVVFDAVEHAKSKGIDVVLADTAGRSHADKNLMDELKKICRVNKPDLKILIIDSLVGNDAVPQARMFEEAVGVDAVMFSKVDVNERGGSIISVAHILKKPILFLGIGQRYEDLVKFEPETVLENVL